MQKKETDSRSVTSNNNNNENRKGYRNNNNNENRIGYRNKKQMNNIDVVETVFDISGTVKSKNSKSVLDVGINK